METLESSRVCRLCGKQSGISINIFDKNENHVRKINAVLPIMVHEMDLLPKHMCHRCSYKLEEFHKFYVDCLKTDTDLKSQLSWMGKKDPRKRVGIPMVHIENIKIKIEPPDYDAYDMAPMVGSMNYINSVSSMAFEPKDISFSAYRCRCCCDKMDQSNRTISADYQTTTIPHCNRLSDVDPEINDHSNVPQATKRSPLTDETYRERSNVLTQVIENSRLKTSDSNSPNRVENIQSSGVIKEDKTKNVIVRNLRPRKVLVNYAGTRKKSSPRSKITKLNIATLPPQPRLQATQIKMEKFEDFEGRVLRPRKGTIDYIGPKRKYSRSSNKNQRPLKKEFNINTDRVRNIANKLKSPSENMMAAAINAIKHYCEECNISFVNKELFKLHACYP